MDAAPLVIGIDIAASRPCVAVAVRCGRTLDVMEWREADEREPGDRGRLLEWVSAQRPAVVGVDAPQRPKRALPGGAPHSRVCDAELLHRRISVYQVPTRAQAEAKRAPVRLDAHRLGVLQGPRPARLRAAEPGRVARRARSGAGRPRGVSARRLRDAARRHAAAQEHARGAAPARARPAASGAAVGRLLRPRLARRPHGGVHGLALRPGPRDAARRRARRLHLAARHRARVARQVRAAHRAGRESGPGRSAARAARSARGRRAPGAPT